MQVEFGNPAPTAMEYGPVVTYSSVPDDGYDYQPHESAEELANALARHIATAPGGVTRVADISGGTGNHEAFLSVVAGWRSESNANPTWVWSDNGDFAVLLGKFFGCPVGRPDDVEDTHYTYAGPPGTAPEVSA